MLSFYRCPMCDAVMTPVDVTVDDYGSKQWYRCPSCGDEEYEFIR